jgi:oleandomycin transport system permease protein
MTTMTEPLGTLPGTITPRVNPLEAVRHTLTLAWRSLVQIKHNPQDLIDLSLQPIMFTVLFAYVFGTAISGSTHNYLEFAIAGIITQNALFVTINTGVAMFTDVEKGVFDRFRSMPIARLAPLAGRILADIVRQAWSMMVVVLVGLAMGFRFTGAPFGVVGAFAILLAFTFAFSWVSVLIGLMVDAVEKVQIFAFTILFPITFTSGTFVPLNTMPGWMQAWAKYSPVTYLTNAVRGLFVGGPVADPVLKTLLWAAGLMLVFTPLALRAFRRQA